MNNHGPKNVGFCVFSYVFLGPFLPLHRQLWALANSMPPQKRLTSKTLQISQDGKEKDQVSLKVLKEGLSGLQRAREPTVWQGIWIVTMIS